MRSGSLNSMKEELRNCFVEEMIKMRASDYRLYIILSDSSSTCRIKPFSDKYPDAVINVGIAEQNMVGIAAGMALGGLIPFTANATPFLMGRSNEQVKTDICYSRTNVKLIGLNPGFAYGSLGATHHCLDDISTARSFGNILIFAPCDPLEVRQVTQYAANYNGPVYIRLDSFKAQNIHTDNYNFKPGEPVIIRRGTDISLVALGTMVHNALGAAEKLEESGISAQVLSLPSIRPLNTRGIISNIMKTGAVLTLEEHSTHGGIGSIIAEIILDNHLNCLLKRAGVPVGSFAEAIPRVDLQKLYGLDVDSIVNSAEWLVSEKPGRNQYGRYILSIDQGTSGSKAIIFDDEGKIQAEGRCPLSSYYPAEGYVEQDPNEILESVLTAVHKAVTSFISNGNNSKSIECCGITNQRETFILWDKSGCPLTPAVVWQCKRSISVCRSLIDAGHEQFIRKRTGLFIDPYFSGTKIIRLAEEHPEIRQAIDSGKVYFGTVDSWLLYKLTDGASHKTDYTNASRTMLFNLKELTWDNELLELFGLSNLILPEVSSSGNNFGYTDFNGGLPRPIQITAMIGDSHSAAFGERCFDPGSAKVTMGTGSSILLNTGTFINPIDTKMVSTICWSTKNTVSYALEGIIVSCGSTITWLKDQLGLFESSKEAAQIAEETENSGSVVLIPAFSGLGAPWWKMSQQAEIRGLTFESHKNQIIRAGFESVAFQVTDVLQAMENDMKKPLKSVRIDGGVSDSNFVMSSIAGLNSAKIIKCRLREASSLGAALIAGHTAGVFNSIAQLNELDYNDEIISGVIIDSHLSEKYQQWIKIMNTLK